MKLKQRDTQIGVPLQTKMTTKYIWKDSLNSDSQQIHQYQSFIFTH